MTPLRRTLVHVVDAWTATKRIDEYLGELDINGFLATPVVIDAIQLRFVVLQEALSRVERDAPAVFARIGDTHQIRGFRNRIVHEYEKIDPTTVFDIAKREPPGPP